MAQPNLEASLPTEEFNLYLDQIATLPEQLRTVVEGITPTHMRESYRAGGWSAAQIVHHLADAHMNMVIRMKLALTEDEPKAKSWSQDDWAVLADTGSEQVEDSLLILEGLHRRAARLLSTLGVQERTRRYYHPVYDRWYTIDQAVGMMAWHGQHHLAQMRQIIPAEEEVPRG